MELAAPDNFNSENSPAETFYEGIRRFPVRLRLARAAEVYDTIVRLQGNWGRE